MHLEVMDTVVGQEGASAQVMIRLVAVGKEAGGYWSGGMQLNDASPWSMP